MSSYNNYLRTKNGNLCCCPGAQGPKGPQGVQGAQGTKGIQGVQGVQGVEGASSDLRIIRGYDVSNVQVESIFYDASMIELTPPSERGTLISSGPYYIIGDDTSFNVLPFGGDISNNRPIDLRNKRLNRSTWIKFKPNWKEIYPNSVPFDDPENAYGYIPFYWSVP